MLKIKIKTVRLFLAIFLLIFIFTSCVSKKRIVYFQNDIIDQKEVNNSYNTIIKPDDLLQITISARNIEAVKPFNLVSSPNIGTGVGQQLNYLVDSNGEIDFPVIGKLKIGGLPREEVINLLKNKLSPDYVKAPSINIRITNFKISVLGDVSSPGTYTIPNERITIIEALGLAGDLNISGQRENILIIREENNKKVKYSLDLKSNTIFTSPAYYLQQNDVVYVEPNYATSQSASSNSNTGLFITLGSLLLSLILTLTR